ncbi:MAG: SpoIIE family protein phosphatase [Bacteroidales bacterium]|nr:SpoIIE family protein phosphatase [Bacteroidales bacterium]
MFRQAVIIWICLGSLTVYGQQFYFDQFSVSEGLAQSTVYKMIQDRNDVYWLGTRAGVARFDGANFINYAAADGLAENGVRAICEDRDGRIWFGHTGGGISLYNGSTFSVVPSLAILNHSTITSILMDTEFNLWFTTEGAGVIKLSNPEAPPGQFQFEQFSGSELSDQVYGHHMDHDGKIYFISDLGVKYFNPDSVRFDHLLLNGVPKFYQTTSILFDSKGRIWIGKYHGGLYRYNPNADSTVMYDLVKAGLKSNWISALLEDSEGNIWAGTFEGGVVRISPDNSLELYNNQNGFPGLKVWSMMQDHEGNILFGTSENGVCIYKGDNFISYFKDDGLISSQIQAILQSSDGSYWFGTNRGISILDRESDGGSIHDFDLLKADGIEFLKEDQNGTIWIGTNMSGVYSYHRTRGLRRDARLNNLIGQYKPVMAMEIDHDNFLWLGALDGLIYYDIDKQSVVKKFTQFDDRLKGSRISMLFIDSNNRVWIGHDEKGITLVEEGEFIDLKLGFDFTPLCLTEDQDGTYWIGTEGRGVIHYDAGRQQIIHVYTESGGELLANLINQLNVDRYNNIYVGTNKGLNIFFREKGRFYAFTARSGFVGIETKPNASYVDKAGDLWFGTVEGVTKYHTSRQVPVAGEPAVHITGMQVNHKPVSMDQGLSLSHRQNSIIFEYGSITLNPDEVEYQIMLDGVAQEWRLPDKHTSAIYPVLPHGRYTFRVKAKNTAGVWNMEPASFSFTIRPPFYLTWYFILSMAVLLVIIVLSYVKIRERALKRENLILEGKVMDRTAIVVAQKEELTRKNENITDSIRYAKRIQIAILPEKSPYPDTFILFKPKDIVSGDFYWFTEVGDKEFFSAVDCTGHGVPGAFMSIIGHNSLTKIVREYGILEPGKILNQLNKEVLETLHQRSDAGDVYDGMDLALACYDRKGKYLEFSGAFNPLYLIRDGELLETKADKQSIGRSAFNTDAEFTNHRIDIEKGDTLYLFSDGYADQFGGEHRKKFKYKNLKETILKIQKETMSQQRAILDHTIEKWRGDQDQLDDILVIGRRF